MIIGRSKKRELDAREQNKVAAAAQVPQAENADDREREIRGDVPKVRNAAIIRKQIVGLVLCDAWHEEEESRDDQRQCSGYDKSAAIQFAVPLQPQADGTRRTSARDGDFSPKLGSLRTESERIDFGLVFKDEEDNALLVGTFKIRSVGFGREDQR